MTSAFDLDARCSVYKEIMVLYPYMHLKYTATPCTQYVSSRSCDDYQYQIAEVLPPAYPFTRLGRRITSISSEESTHNCRAECPN